MQRNKWNLLYFILFNIFLYLVAYRLNNYNNMQREYIIQIAKDQPYPFLGQKKHFNQIFVRTDFPINTSQQYQQISSKIDLACKIDSAIVIQMARLLQIRSQKLILDYQYVAQPLKGSKSITDASYLSVIQKKLQQAIQILTLYGLKYQLKIQDMGISKDHQLKIFIGLNFKIVDERQRQNLNKQYQDDLSKFIKLNFSNLVLAKNNCLNQQLLDYSIRLDKKLNKIQEKLQRRRRRKNSLSGSSNRDKHKQKSTDYQSNMVGELLLNRKYSNGSLTDSAASSSCHSSNQKIHKSSFEDYSSTSYCLNQSKEDLLNKRISAAREKTQAAFKTYNKTSRKKFRW